MDENLLLLDSITDANIDSAGQVVISGSHGGLYPASIASNWGVRAVIFNDAGIGYNEAGISGVLKLADIGMAAATVDCWSCRIGSATDAAARGQISVVNKVAEQCGLSKGMLVTEALELLFNAPVPVKKIPRVSEARSEITLPVSGRAIQLLDSASLVNSKDTEKIVVTGSHGGLIGGDSRRALKARARIGVFNDAGVGIEGIGITRLPALDQINVAAVTISCHTARIGDACSTLETGVISHTNSTAKTLGAKKGLALKAWLENMID